MKRGQVNFFVAVGLLALLIVALAIVLNKWSAAPQQSQALPLVRTLTEKCLEQTLQEGIHLASMQGGYITAPPQLATVSFGGYAIPFAYAEGVVTMPSLEEIATEQLAPYVARTLDTCTDRYKAVSLRGIEIAPPKVTVTITDIYVKASLYQPITAVMSTGERQTLETFTAQVRSPLSRMHATASSLLAVQQKEPSKISITALSTSAFVAQTYHVMPQVLLTTLMDNATLLAGKPPTFMYASLLKKNMPPELRLPGEFVLGNAPYALHAVDADNDKLLFGSDSELFPVTPDGRVVAKASPGRYLVTFFVMDSRGQADRQVVEVVVP
ncbi:hypothetical protein HY639_04625 [Candidatus Woesearchaeota archaeon]|nr:hypothetical protein [Candidatus Woesearchaeota archaeon]